jgi:hypothetical protein
MNQLMRLFKYTSHFGLAILHDLQLKVTPPNELNDPFEFSPYPTGKITEQQVQRYVNNFSPRQFYDELKKRGEKLPPFEDLAADIGPSVAASGVPFVQRGFETAVAGHLDAVSRKFGLVCFTERENNILMWSHYSDSHKGVLLEFDGSHQYFKGTNLNKVVYARRRVALNAAWSGGDPRLRRVYERLLRTKNIAWRYESEWRWLLPLDRCHKKIDDGRTLYFAVIPPDLVTRVVLGLRCPAAVVDEVAKARAKRGLGFEVLKADVHRTDFTLEYKPTEIGAAS